MPRVTVTLGVMALLVLLCGLTPAGAADPVTIVSTSTSNAFHQPETEFAGGEPLWVSCTFDIDEALPFNRAKVSLVVTAFGEVYRTSWMPVADLPGLGWTQGPVGLTVLVPVDAPLGDQDMQVELRLKRLHSVYAQDSELVPVTVLEESKIDWQQDFAD